MKKGDPHFVAAGGSIASPSSSRMTRSRTRSKGTNIEVTNSGIAYKPQVSWLAEVNGRTGLSCPKESTKGQNSKTSVCLLLF